MLAATRSHLGLPVNEIQRSLNGLGDLPNDFEAAVDLQYTPVRQGWYYGYPVTGGGYASVPRCGARAGLGEATPEAAAALVRVEKLQTVLQVVSTLAITTIASLAVMRAIHVRRGGDHGRMFGDEE